MPMKISAALGDEGSWRGDACPIDHAVSAIGSRASMLLIREAFYGTTRFASFVAHTGLTDAVVAARLRGLVNIGAMSLRPYREGKNRPRNEYILTESGEALLPIVVAMMQWGSNYIQSDGGPVRAVDIGTDERLVMGPRDRQGQSLSSDDILIVPNPAWATN